MIRKIKDLIKSNRLLGPIVLKIYHFLPDLILFLHTKKEIKTSLSYKKVIFYIGIPAHSNLGDLAQGVCIRKWLKKHYPDTPVIEIETNALVNTEISLLNLLQKSYREGDFIVFQSGYTTTDLGGFADEMHREVMKILPKAKMLMMPQTIYFQNELNEKRTSKCYNNMINMLYLARDRISYEKALEMFPDIPVIQFPDIVTTLIGKHKFDYKRQGILFCCRDDTEQYYSDNEINKLMKKCSTLGKVVKTDTTKQGKISHLVSHAEEYIENEIDTYAHYRVIITDRYHGTILSLAAGTPVIIIRTTDHKVTTGVEWFNGVYDDYVFLAESLEDAYKIAKELYEKDFNHNLKPYFETKYYDKLPNLLEDSIGKV